jgi:type IV secretory pathway TrbF-like protein
LVTWFATNVFFIQLDNTAKRRNYLISWVHHLTDRMTHFSSAFLRDANPFSQNNRGYAFG